jgi:toxin HigB-1
MASQLAVIALTRRLAICNVLGYTLRVIRNFKHKGLARFFETGSKAGIQSPQAERLRLILGLLNAATSAHDMALPGLSLHPLKGDRKGTWAVKVSGNWRVTFIFVGKDANAVDYEDYH